MSKRKRTNNGLLACLKIVAILSFVFLLGGYGLYAWHTSDLAMQVELIQEMIAQSIPSREGEKEDQSFDIERMYQVDDLGKITEVGNYLQEILEGEPSTTEANSEVLEESRTSEGQQTSEGLASNLKENEREEGYVTENQSGENHIEANDIEEVNKQDAVETEQEIVDGQIEGANTPSAQETSQQNQENLMKEVTSVLDMPVLEEYNVTLTDEMMTDIGHIVEGEEEEVMGIVGKYFENLTLEEKFQLIGLVTDKMENIDVAYVWELVSDGVSGEDVVILNQVVEDHFTEQELDLLYGYYVDSALLEIE